MSIFGAVGIGEKKFVASESVPSLWLSHNAPIQSLTSSLWLWDLAVEYNGAVYTLGEPVAGAPAIIWKYTSGAWTNLATTGLDGSVDEAYLFFIAANGNMYISFLANNKIYRSTDGGVTFAVIASATQTSGGEFRSMTEDEDGNLYIVYYDASSPADGTEIYLGKSTDNGATFTDITSNMGSLTDSKHIHSVNYDDIRGTLFVCLGDDGTTETTRYSTDKGVTFNSWVTGQVVSMTFDSSYIYMSTELTNDNSIYRAANAGDTPAKVYADPDPGNAGFCWNCHTDNYGHVFFMYGSASNDQARCVVTANNGDSWADIYPPSIAVADRQNFARIARASFYAGGENGFFYNGGYQYRIYPARHEFLIDQTDGFDPYVNSTSTFNVIPDGGGLDNKIIKLMENYTLAYTPGTNNIVVNKNGFTFSDVVTGSELFTMDLETAAHVDGSTPLAGSGDDKMSSYTTSASGDVDASSTEAHNGTLSMKCASGGGLAFGRKDLIYGSISVGDVAWWACWIYFDKATAPAGNVGLGQIVNGCNLMIRATGFVTAQTPQAGGNGRFDQIVSGTAMPLQTWFYLKMAVKRSTQGSGNGYIKVWQNGKLVIEAIGIDTNAAGTDYTRAYFGATEGAQTEVMYVDEMVCTDFDPDKPTSPVLNGSAQTIIPDGITS